MGDNKLSIKLDERTVQGKKVKILRRQGFVPGVVYGYNIDPINIQIEAGVMKKLYAKAGTYTPVHLDITGKRKIAMIKDVDYEPVKGTIRHVSFHAIKMSDPVVAEVPVRLIGEGESEAEKNGLIILQNLERIEVKALPLDLPEAVEVDIRELKEAGDKVTLGDAKLPSGVEFVEHESGHGEEDEEKPRIVDLQVASVWEPAALEAANAAAAGTAEDESDVEAENGEAGPDSAGEEGKAGAQSEGKPDEQTKPE